MIGREQERQELIRLYGSTEAQFVAIYGRLGVGKTYLVSSVFDGMFTFRHSGISPVGLDSEGKGLLRSQLNQFYNSLRIYGLDNEKCPQTWMEAFYLLEKLLIQKDDGSRQLVFIDELPWLDTPRSGFIPALEGFWNSWACGRKNLMLVVCGSANSWILNKLINNHGGLYGRVTYEIKLEPFSLSECEAFFKEKGIALSRYDMTQSYMMLGGIPYYMGYFSSSLSLAQNIDSLFFDKKAKLRFEFERLFKSIFDNPERAESIVRLLSTKSKGYSRKEIVEATGIKEGGAITELLRALVASDFVILYTPFGESRKNTHYKLINPFCLFYLRFVEWNDSTDNPAITAFNGLAFENVCYNHIRQIKKALGISGVVTKQSTWMSEGDDGFQICIVVERRDRIVNICDLKFCNDEFSVSKEYYRAILRRQNLIAQHIGKKCAIRNTLITTFGLKKNEYCSVYSDVLVLDDLFIPWKQYPLRLSLPIIFPNRTLASLMNPSFHATIYSMD